MFSSPAKCGFSLVELVTTIAVLGILSAISIQSYLGLHLSAREGVARDTLSLLNHALLHFNQTNWDIVLNAVPASSSDELAVLHTLQWRNPNATQASPGSPYISANFKDTTSSSVDDFRLQWNGHTFELLAPGTLGAGLKTGSTSPDPASTYSFPVSYQPLGPAQQ